MSTRTVAAIALALLLALSGCSALDLGSSGDDGSLESVSFPAETGPDGLGDHSQLLAAHQDSLAEDSYRLAFNLTYNREGEGAETTTIVASNESEARQLLQSELPGRSLDRFTSAERTFSRLREGDETIYDVQALPVSTSEVHYRGARPGPMLQTIVEVGNYSATGAKTVDGRTIVTFEATDVRTGASGQLPDEPERVNATVRIDEQGRIWSAELFATGRSDGAAEIFHQEFRTLAVGDVFVTRPAWVSNATE